MHDTAMINAKHFVNTYITSARRVKLVDIGAQNVTGSLKDVCGLNVDYTGVDFVKGKDVDIVLDNPYNLPFDDNSFDVVTASSCFEHSEFFWELFLEMLRIAKPNGLIYLNVPSNGRYHKYPVDCWRFYPDSGIALSNYGNRKGYSCSLVESYISNQIRVWNDFVCVIIKDRVFMDDYKVRITDSFDKYSNGRVSHSENGCLLMSIKNEIEIPEDQRFWGWRLNKFSTRLMQKAALAIGLKSGYR